MNRRGFLGALLATPFVIRDSGVLMPVRRWMEVTTYEIEVQFGVRMPDGHLHPRPNSPPTKFFEHMDERPDEVADVKVYQYSNATIKMQRVGFSGDMSEAVVQVEYEPRVRLSNRRDRSVRLLSRGGPTERIL